MNYLPLFADLTGRHVLVVGGGAVAERKVEMLLKAGAEVGLVAEKLNPALAELAGQRRIEWLDTKFQPSRLDAVWLVIAATDNHELNRQVSEAAESRRIWANVVDERDACSFIFPSVVNRNPIQIAISSGGTAPVLARLLREKLEALLPQNLGAMAETAARWRGRVKAKLPSIAQRRRFWETLFTHPAFLRLSESSQTSAAEEFLSQQLNGAQTGSGEVSLVGAGPGDAGLLTLKGLQRIQQADVVLYDALVSDQVLELIRRDAEKVFVGKRAGKHSVMQEATNRLLVDYAKKGKRVVRLKGGDPFVFGRGGEELEALKAEGIAFEVVPGITAALGATAYAGIPLTHRDHAQTAMFITGHCRAGSDDLAWQTIAQSNQTLVVYMGTIKAAELQTNLIAHGRSADTPVAVISKGTLPDQQVFSGKLNDLAVLAAQAPSPALLVIGETAGLGSDLAWFGGAPQQFVDTRNALWQVPEERALPKAG
ncbi:siroheme synthase CysG [Neisseria canis]|uniref:Siroheme synthase n=1 Tax=Neisseria canis TaxID=493 RepID=A0A448D6S6_9NEIS|nr:siroheme synthase CysG [Neisseria canis]OSI11660.1 uroporphyrinogen-III C-methyltransferase [Neisseria canis]VEF00150.1 siroheme synthase [Neisseria canis]